MDQDQIVIVTQMSDPHADDVVVALERMGHDATRLNYDEIPGEVVVSSSWGEPGRSDGARIEILSSGRVIETELVRSVWWRRPTGFALPADLSVQERHFATKETEHALRSLWASMDCYWMSAPDCIQRASWKGEQLSRARRLGFEVPRTLVTTDPYEARRFMASCGGQMIFKVMTDPFLGAETLAEQFPDQESAGLESETTLVTEDDADLLESVVTVPCQFQEYIPKSVEFRVTIVGDEVFAAEIDSQLDARTAVDWRRPEVDVPWTAATLPVEVEERCLELVRSYGLNYSALDLIRTPDDRFVFLENNPNGQYLFVEDRLPEFAITDAVASCLVRGGN